VAQLYAVLALIEAGFEPAGEVILTGTAQETGHCPAYGTGADEWTSPHGHEGNGARWLIENGVLGDFALVGEPTGFAVCTAQAGYLRVRVRVTGLMPYTPFLARDPATGLGGNPVEAAAGVVQAIAAWAARYEAASSTDVPGGRVVPRAQVQEVRSSFPAFTNQADQCDIFVDIRTPPASAPMAILRDLAGELRAAGHDVAVQCCGYRRGYLADGARSLIDAVRTSHGQVFGAEPPPPMPAQMSMWQDTNAFNEAGIPSVSYGIRPRPERRTREGIRALHADDLMALVEVYARVIMTICAG
jgi:acetylornithine deacetylase/succinyl-diaminopimelate desuccinylase-like protein